MACINLLRAVRLLVCGLCLLLGTVQVALAQDSSLYNELEDLSSGEDSVRFPQVRDVQLRRTYMALVSMFSDASREAADRYGCSELRMLSNDLDSHIRTVNDNTEKPDRLELKRRAAPEENDNSGEERESMVTRVLSELAFVTTNNGHDTEQKSTAAQHPAAAKRGLLSGIGKLLGGGDGDAGADSAAVEGMGKAMGGIFNKLLSATGSGLAGAGFFGGVGIGEGAAQGLNLSTPDKTKTLGAQVAQENGMKSSGLNPIIQNAAMGLTATALRAVTGSGVLNALQLPSLADAADALGSGIGSGGAVGLGLSKSAGMSPAALNSSGLVGGIGALGFGATRALTSNVNFSALLPAAGGLDIGRIALTTGQGIGAGAAGGLKLTKTDAGPPLPASNADIPGIAGTFAFGLSKALAGSLNVSAQSLGAMLPPVDFASAALSVGDGIGSGAALGLKLTQNDTSGFGTPAAPAAAAAGGPIDLSKIAGTLAFGVSKSLTGSLNASGASLSSLIPADADVGGIILGAGRGIGSGASAGLGLSDLAGSLTNNNNNNNNNNKNLSARADPANPLADVAGLVEKFTFGLSNSFTDKINLTSQVKNLAGALPSVDLGATVSGVGSGLGLGIAKGLDLGNKAVVPPPKPTSFKDLPELAATFAFGLSDSLVGQLNVTGLTKELVKNAGGLAAQFATPVASGLGKGIGIGAAVGLGLQPESAITPPAKDAAAGTEGSDAMGGIDAEGLSQSFAASLTSGLLANNTAGELLKSVSGSGGSGTDGGGIGSLLANVDVPRVANGLARGLLTGAGDGVQALGGIDAIIKGSAVAPAGAIPETKVDFNDSANGAAIGLGQGLGTSGVVTLQKLLAKGLGSNSSSNPQRRDLAVFGRRQEDDGAGAPLNLSRLVDASAVSTIGQKGIDVLTCDGVAGLFLLALGLQKSGTVSLETPSGNTLETLKSLIPKGIIEVESRGNTFSIDGTQLADKLGQSALSLASTLTINGRPVVTYAVLLALHIVIAVLALYIIWPLVLTFGSMQTMAARFRIPVLLTRRTAKASKIFRLFVLPPSLLLILIFGVLSGAAKGHFRTAHGILSLFTLIFAIAAVALSFIAKPTQLTSGDPMSLTVKPNLVTWASHACNQVLLALLLPTATTGFTDLNSVTLCLTRSIVSLELAVGLGMGLVFVFLLGQYTSSLEMLLLITGNRAARTNMLVKVASPPEVVTGVEIGPPVLRSASPVNFNGMESRENITGEEPKNFI
ncbi:hypothetical protein ISF_00325 [Cordyceps fumosorosea ARSEF 2679]|uniref:Uncharacterized protein n=1 Tax=Cordyceps fumosorosea (strain ARSEF 2679) TaxID=1081104 RepID=A0A162LNQ7_CORFA|nr:hypothetical protein ISF_00325 [Cordyceps fumosorosea ARSEF 2679]OAA73424.1 hypothetical protein ISF_00325 [Cordyceps fumosorosea ARSEF 2679]